ncbi:endonuclease/exonuclease/phosphatase family protein [Enterococcus sp. LJL120]
MKLLTLNTHSWLEENQLEKLTYLAEKIATEAYDLIALQEVNQLWTNDNETTELNADNFGGLLVKALAEKELFYEYHWVPVHLGFNKYDEGLAILSRLPVKQTKEILISDDYPFADHRRRKALGVELIINGRSHWFYSLHFSWWQQNPDEGFLKEWQTLTAHLQDLKHQQTGKALIFLLGDFNNPAQEKKQGYQLIRADGWYDTFVLAEKTSGSATVEAEITGWENNQQGIRIDYIFVSEKIPVRSSKVCFDGQNAPVVSDHYGVEIVF